MKSRRRNVSSDHLQTIVRHHRTRSSTIVDGREYSEPIQIELIIEILLRLPSKSIAKCRCVSKRWSYILRLPYFTDLFLTRSYARPQLLFACQNHAEVIFYTSPQPQNPNENSPSLLVNRLMRIRCGTTNHRMRSFYGSGYVSAIFSPISSGLVCIDNDLVICNPTTRQSLFLPKFRKNMHTSKSFFGYDPIEKQFKVLSVTLSYGEYNASCDEHRVLTLGTGKPSWRMIACSVPHYPRSNGICINGVLYYKASVKGSFENRRVICFDVRSEKYSFVSVMDTFVGAVHDIATLVNYNGKLASLKPEEGSDSFGGTNKIFEMYVLEDPEKQEWSKHVYKLPSLWKNVVGESVSLHCAGMTSANEIVLSTPDSPSSPFYIVYYNIDRETVSRVEIQRMKIYKGDKVYTFLDHLEDVKLIR